MFDLLTEKIKEYSTNDFKKATESVRKFIDNMKEEEFKDVVKEVGVIPEHISHDSTEEKLYSKASDIVLSRCFRMLGLASIDLNERGDSADIIAESKSGYNYSLVADAKCFRLSRTARNQKDYKITNLSAWRGSEHEYCVLVAPYYQYPQTRSQIYSNSLDKGVCLLSWEHISILLENNIRETETFSLESIWNASSMMARDSSLAFANAQKCFLPKMNEYIAKKMGVEMEQFNLFLSEYRKQIIARGKDEIMYWNGCVDEIRKYSKERAISELIETKKLQEKIRTISAYVERLDK
ncbi:hypothetical protein M2150_001672 [Lachnospiraceae bacterium PM6-15]|uniref:HindIII family type II restriction endonuclease n=1 Tax=Ohessyouella blattaphilus TaxID=2949333 RepID=UPI003E2824BB